LLDKVTGWTGNPSLLERERQAKECLDKHGIKWSSVGNGSLLINVKGRFYYYYPTRNRWRAKGSNKEYSIRSIDYLIELLSK
jgi:hypothetical protein